MSAPRGIRVLLAAALSVGLGCSGSDDGGSPSADFSGEFTYEVTGSGGTCAALPRDSGSGVEIVYQDAASVTSCFKRDLCDGEFCRGGSVEGNTWISLSEFLGTEGPCTYRAVQTVTTTREASGSASRRIDTDYQALSGDCSASVLPCATWQTSVLTPCAAACYDAYCAGAPAARPGQEAGADRLSPRKVGRSSAR